MTTAKRIVEKLSTPKGRKKQPEHYRGYYLLITKARNVGQTERKGLIRITVSNNKAGPTSGSDFSANVFGYTVSEGKEKARRLIDAMHGD